MGSKNPRGVADRHGACNYLEVAVEDGRSEAVGRLDIYANQKWRPPIRPIDPEALRERIGTSRERPSPGLTHFLSHFSAIDACERFIRDVSIGKIRDWARNKRKAPMVWVSGWRICKCTKWGREKVCAKDGSSKNEKMRERWSVESKAEESYMRERTDGNIPVHFDEGLWKNRHHSYNSSSQEPGTVYQGGA